MEIKDAENWFKQLKQKDLEKLIAVGFTKEQAEVLLEIMQTKSMSGGLF